MHRAWKLALVVGIAALLLALPTRALAFHVGALFDQPSGAGGGGGITYVGVPGERGWNCTACHIDPPGLIKVTLSSDPATLLDGSTYEPGHAYTLTARLVGEHEGLGVPQANFNSLAVSVVDSHGAAAGSFSGYAPEEFYAHGAASILSAGLQTGANTWVFSWQAPAGAVGSVTLYVAAVDGNGANGQRSGTLTDPFGDDTFVSSVTLRPAGAKASGRATGQGLPLGTAVVGALWGLGRVRRPRRSAGP